jgi:hypothetical protein
MQFDQFGFLHDDTPSIIGNGIMTWHPMPCTDHRP